MSARFTFLTVVVAAFLFMFVLSEWHDRLLQQSAELAPVMPAASEVDSAAAKFAADLPLAEREVVRNEMPATMAAAAVTEDGSAVVPEGVAATSFESAAARHQEELRRARAR
jgi:hypothetical protein